MQAATIIATQGKPEEGSNSQILERIDNIDEKARKLHALLMNTWGQSGDSFRALHSDLQDAILQVCTEIAGDIKEAAYHFHCEVTNG